MLVCFISSHTRLRVRLSTRHSLRPLRDEGKVRASLGRDRAAGMPSYVVIPGRAVRRGPGIHNHQLGLWILRCAIAHHSSLVSLAPRNDGRAVWQVDKMIACFAPRRAAGDSNRRWQQSGNHPLSLSAALTFSKIVAAKVAGDRAIV